MTVWVTVLIRGVLAVIFGLLLWVVPISYKVGILFSVYATLNGILAGVAAIRSPDTLLRGWNVAQGILSVVAGVVVLGLPTLSAYARVTAIWAATMGVADMFAATAGRKTGSTWGWTLATGLLSIFLGIVLLQPGITLLKLVSTLGLFAVAIGLAQIGLAFRIRVAPRTLAS